MATYKSGTAEVAIAIETLYNRIANPEQLKSLTENSPAEIADRLKDVTFSSDSITFNVQPVGQLELKLVTKEEPTKVVYKATQSPVPFGISMEMKKIDDTHTQAEAIIDIDIPIFLKPMVDGKMKEMAQQFRTLMTQMSAV